MIGKIYIVNRLNSCPALYLTLSKLLNFHSFDFSSINGKVNASVHWPLHLHSPSGDQGGTQSLGSIISFLDLLLSFPSVMPPDNNGPLPTSRPYSFFFHLSEHLPTLLESTCTPLLVYPEYWARPIFGNLAKGLACIKLSTITLLCYQYVLFFQQIVFHVSQVETHISFPNLKKRRYGFKIVLNSPIPFPVKKYCSSGEIQEWCSYLNHWEEVLQWVPSPCSLFLHLHRSLSDCKMAKIIPTYHQWPDSL